MANPLMRRQSDSGSVIAEMTYIQRTQSCTTAGSGVIMQTAQLFMADRDFAQRQLSGPAELMSAVTIPYVYINCTVRSDAPMLGFLEEELYK